MLNTFRAGFSRAGFNLDSSLLGSFPSSLSFVEGAGPGGIVVNGGVTTTGLSGITSAGPNNAAGVWNRRNLFTYADDLQISKGIHPALWITAGIGAAVLAITGRRKDGSPGRRAVLAGPRSLSWTMDPQILVDAFRDAKLIGKDETLRLVERASRVGAGLVDHRRSTSDPQGYRRDQKPRSPRLRARRG